MKSLFKNKAQAKQWLFTSAFATPESDAMTVLFQTGYYVPGYGSPWDITLEILEKLKSNFDGDVLGSAISIYYAHWDAKRTAAGEIKRLEVKYDTEMGKYQLMGKVEWTKKGMEAVKDKEYKYISSEVIYDFSRAIDSNTTKSYGPLLTGAALVNEPGVWDIPQIVFSGKKKFVDKFITGRKTEPKSDTITLEDKQMDELLKKLGFKSATELEAAFGNLKDKISEFENSKEKSAFDAAVKAKDAEIEALKAKIENTEKEHFEKDKKEYLEALFKAEKITKERLDMLMGYNKDEFDTFRKVFEENFAAAESKLPKIEGHGNEGKPESKVINISEFAKEWEGKKQASFFRGVK